MHMYQHGHFQSLSMCVRVRVCMLSLDILSVNVTLRAYVCFQGLCMCLCFFVLHVSMFYLHLSMFFVLHVSMLHRHMRIYAYLPTLTFRT
jgi:hypothetical protein